VKDLVNAHSYTYSIKNLSIDHLYIIACERLKQNQNITDDNKRSSPCIDVDVSWIIRGIAKGNIDDRIEYILKLSSTFTKAGFLVHLVCDGVYCHHSKHAMIHRITDAQRKKLDVIVKKSQLMLLLQQRQDTDSISERNDIQQTEKILRAKIRSL
jgi:hypothetical protein